MRTQIATAVLGAFFLGFAVSHFEPSPQVMGGQTDPPKKWEYRVLVFSVADEPQAPLTKGPNEPPRVPKSYLDESATKELNRLAAEGWEYAGVLGESFSLNIREGYGKGAARVSVALKKPK